ncbi:MAG: Heat-shock protein [uncultured Thiotrichaceae bacterium]|uniref:Heat-shock protein n=1 Tax=uncultured Thiotrichaceae bacterium TaxID=298394 RepID=A0A6S6T5C6_9GAMM|nr:MAG: Heat-shock protein [uncultured Thiotrichaceae bacterium]
MSNQEVTNQTDAPVSQQEKMTTLRPLVSIVESDTGFTLTAEIPGVPKENVEVNVENDTLTLSGAIKMETPEGMEATYAEVRDVCYKRAFTLSRELDASKIQASQANGVLTLNIPKAEHAQPRKIEVQIG